VVLLKKILTLLVQAIIFGGWGLIWWKYWGIEYQGLLDTMHKHFIHQHISLMYCWIFPLVTGHYMVKTWFF